MNNKLKKNWEVREANDNSFSKQGEELVKLFKPAASINKQESPWSKTSQELLSSNYSSLAELLPELTNKLSAKLPLDNLTAEEQASAVKNLLDLHPELRQELTDIFKLSY